jgi:hypothetical protein
MQGLQLTYNIPEGTLWWQEFIDSVATDPAYADLVSSYNTFLSYVDPSPSNDSPLKRRVIIDPNTPLTRKVQWSMSDLPAGSTAEQAHIHYKIKVREYIIANNDAPYTESAEESFDGIPRSVPKNLALTFFTNYNEANGYNIFSMEMVDVDF